jgi:hypothetical protein
VECLKGLLITVLPRFLLFGIKPERSSSIVEGGLAFLLVFELISTDGVGFTTDGPDLVVDFGKGQAHILGTTQVLFNHVLVPTVHLFLTFANLLCFSSLCNVSFTMSKIFSAWLGVLLTTTNKELLAFAIICARKCTI